MHITRIKRRSRECLLFVYYSRNVFRLNQGLEVLSSRKFFVSSDLNALLHVFRSQNPFWFCFFQFEIWKQQLLSEKECWILEEERNCNFVTVVLPSSTSESATSGSGPVGFSGLGSKIGLHNVQAQPGNWAIKSKTQLSCLTAPTCPSEKTINQFVFFTCPFAGL